MNVLYRTDDQALKIKCNISNWNNRCLSKYLLIFILKFFGVQKKLSKWWLGENMDMEIEEIEL